MSIRGYGVQSGVYVSELYSPARGSAHWLRLSTVDKWLTLATRAIILRGGRQSAPSLTAAAACRHRAAWRSRSRRGRSRRCGSAPPSSTPTVCRVGPSAEPRPESFPQPSGLTLAHSPSLAHVLQALFLGGFSHLHLQHKGPTLVDGAPALLVPGEGSFLGGMHACRLLS